MVGFFQNNVDFSLWYYSFIFLKKIELNFENKKTHVMNSHVSGQKHSFSFDRVFMPDESQEDVFVEISQLVQSALDGYKVTFLQVSSHI